MESLNRLCVACQNQFGATRGWAKYCSRKCRVSFANKRWRKKQGKSYFKDYIEKNRARVNKNAVNNYHKHKERYLLKSREDIKKYRNIILNAYGHKCCCCGENQREFLSIDHVNGGGYKERKRLGHGGVLRFIVKNNFPPEYRLLCHNCNQALGFYKFCPHNKEFK